MIYIVLGMHKSGTTLVSQILHQSGIDMGNFDISIQYDEGNQYERKETQEINKELLACGDNFSLDVVKSIDDAIPRNFSKLQVRAVTLVNFLNRRHEAWGFKDPRTCLTYQFWKSVLPEHKIVFVYRSPREVSKHYQRGLAPLNFIMKTKRYWKSIAAWYLYNSQCVRYLKNNRGIPFLAVNYSNLMTSDSIFKELEQFIGLPLVDCRRKSLYRSQESARSAIFSLFEWSQAKFFSRPVNRLYNNLEELSKRSGPELL